jgi:hypothetical protein
MKSPDQTRFGYHVRPDGDGWTWETYDLAGQVQERGWAPQKALAAACVIRALAQAASPEPVRNAA